MGRLTHTVSGDIAQFRSPSRVPIESLKFHFLPKQEGSGDPSPNNVRPITGWTGLNGKKSNKGSLFEQGGLVDANGGTGTSVLSTRIRTDFIPYNGEAQLIFDGKGFENDDQIRAIYWYDSSKSFISMAYLSKAIPYTYTVPSNNSFAYFRVVLWKTVNTNNISPTGKWLSVNQSLVPITFPANSKNLYDISTYPLSQGYVLWPGDGTTDSGYPNYATTLNFIPCENIAGKTVTLNKRPGGGNPGFAFYTEANVSSRFAGRYNSSGTAGTPWTIDVPKEAKYMRFSVPANTYDIQIEFGDTSTAYEAYSSDNTFYGGYIDPVAGEIVAEYAIEGPNSGTWTVGSSRSYQWSHTKGGDAQGHYKKNICTHWINNKHNYYSQESVVNVNENGALCIGKDYFVAAGFDYDNLTSSQIAEYLEQLENNGTPFRVCYPLLDPIHIPISPQDLKAFLDYNNFWSDANDITEVTYEVPESRHITAIRRKAMDEDAGHHRLAKWNQLSIDGEFELNLTNYSWNTNYGTMDIANNKIKWTATAVPQQYYNTGFLYKTNYLQIPWNHKVLVMARVKTSAGAGNLIRIFGMVSSSGGAHTYDYNIEVPSNQWTIVKGFIRDRPENPPTGIDDTIIKKFKILIGKKNGYEFDTVCPIGTTLECDMLMAFDLTQMFGLGNELTTVAEFERICALNGIDLTTYHPYDTGSDRWLIVP